MSLVDLLVDFGGWAWERHHNIWSWYIRFPLFGVFCYFAYRRSPWGLALSLLALATSMFWFPAPERPDPQVEEFLAWQAATMSTPMGALGFLVLTVVSLGVIVWLFWRRRWRTGLVLVNLFFGYDLVTGVFAEDANLALLYPTLAGLVGVNGVALVLWWLRRRRTARHDSADHPPAAAAPPSESGSS
ncbi:hypothetical protein F4561_002132 [Lipingzhangella halophila]|uniref:Uncharacterized protein n=1 Tax=Lipingzhangella halophila TaxID=1783352 RepID=A0A7W7RG70_9ACTN|nr:hypothetical protein [Lipingzhangella halophila]MBB4931312.1 hypothetical protein [Lipingzhangella halophila]